MEKQVTKLAPKPKMEKKKKVAAYARVSSGKDAMLHSLAQQISYYSDLIQREPEWSFAGVYADEAFTGTKESRPEFQRLLADCRNGNVDIILTKSISRFARNTVTLLETVTMNGLKRRMQDLANCRRSAKNILLGAGQSLHSQKACSSSPSCWNNGMISCGTSWC